MYLGRADAQVKIRGHRVELSAVESELCAFPGVRAAACKVQDLGGNRELIAFLVVDDPGAPLDLDRLRATLRTKLPEPMVPDRFGFLPDLPVKATSGKLDRSTLPDLAPEAAADRELVPPRSEAERLVARAFSDHLRRGAPVSIQDDFFLDLGGNSLLAAQTVSTLRKSALTAPLTVRDVYEARTVEGLAALADRRFRPCAPRGPPPRRTIEDRPAPDPGRPAAAHLHPRQAARRLGGGLPDRLPAAAGGGGQRRRHHLPLIGPRAGARRAGRLRAARRGRHDGGQAAADRPLPGRPPPLPRQLLPAELDRPPARPRHPVGADGRHGVQERHPARPRRPHRQGRPHPPRRRPARRRLGPAGDRRRRHDRARRLAGADRISGPGDDPRHHLDRRRLHARHPRPDGPAQRMEREAVPHQPLDAAVARHHPRRREVARRAGGAASEWRRPRRRSPPGRAPGPRRCTARR